jgi:hypothetical protein
MKKTCVIRISKNLLSKLKVSFPSNFSDRKVIDAMALFFLKHFREQEIYPEEYGIGFWQWKEIEEINKEITEISKAKKRRKEHGKEK